MDHAHCVAVGADFYVMNPDLTRGPYSSVKEQQAKEICSGCTVRKQCENYANGLEIEHGIYGGKTFAERYHSRR